MLTNPGVVGAGGGVVGSGCGYGLAEGVVLEGGLNMSANCKNNINPILPRLRLNSAQQALYKTCGSRYYFYAK